MMTNAYPIFPNSALGVTAYFSMTEALRVVPPTTVSVVRALEIIMAYGCQVKCKKKYKMQLY